MQQNTYNDIPQESIRIESSKQIIFKYNKNRYKIASKQDFFTDNLKPLMKLKRW